LDGYEQLRSYALSTLKTISRPLGLDFWFKKGFLSWIDVMLRKEYPEEHICGTFRQKNSPNESVFHAPKQFVKSNISVEFPISLANIVCQYYYRME